jgi:hypothetical protein
VLAEVGDNMVVSSLKIRAVGHYAIYLGPALSTSVLQVGRNILEGLVYFLLDLGWDVTALVPTTCSIK